MINDRETIDEGLSIVEDQRQNAANRIEAAQSLSISRRVGL